MVSPTTDSGVPGPGYRSIDRQRDPMLVRRRGSARGGPGLAPRGWGRWPFRRDDRLELGGQKLFVVADHLEEPHIHGPCAEVIGCRAHDRSQPYALIACRSSPLLVMEILRAFARSATGICRLSTPAS